MDPQGKHHPIVTYGPLPGYGPNRRSDYLIVGPKPSNGSWPQRKHHLLTHIQTRITDTFTFIYKIDKDNHFHIYMWTKHNGQMVNSHASYFGCPGFKSWQKNGYPDWGFFGSSQSFEENSGLLLKLSKDCFLLQPFKFIIIDHPFSFGVI
jgi:hypothetical protein